MARFDKTYCSQCGGVFGPGDEGYSHCSDHQRPALTAVQIKGALMVDVLDYGRAVADELPQSQQRWCDAIKEKMALLENHAYAEGRKDEAEARSADVAAEKLIDAWATAKGKPVPWATAVEIIAIVQKLSESERTRLLALWDAE